jgi:hypothetical protein
MKTWIVIAVAACGSKDTPPSPAAASGSAPATAATVDAAPPAPAAAKLPEIATDHALILADKPGGKVAFTLDGGAKTELADGTIVDQTEAPHEDMAHVTSGGKAGNAPAEHVVAGDSVHRAPKGAFAIVTPSVGCGDYCHAAVWLVDGMTGGRWKLTDNSVNPQVAWRADMTAVAVDAGEDGVAVIELPSGKVLAKLAHTYSPAYAPNGTLYLRGPGHEVYEVVDGKPKKVGKGKKPKVEEGEYEQPPDPVTFDASGKWQLGDDEQPTPKKQKR